MDWERKKILVRIAEEKTVANSGVMFVRRSEYASN